MLRVAFSRTMPRGGGRRSPLFTLDEARERLETDALPSSSQRHRPADFPKPADKLFRSGVDHRAKFRLDELQAWLKRKECEFVPYKVEKGIPAPARIQAREENVELIRLVAQLEVGDSLVYEERKNAAVRRAFDSGKRYATRKEGEGTRRIWRIE